MALTFNGTTASLLRSGSIVSDYPFTIFAWTRVATTGRAGFVAELAIDPGPRGTHEGHGALTNGSTMAAWSTVGSGVSAFSASGISAGVWVPCMAVFASKNLRKIYYGNGTVRTESTFIDQSASLLNVLAIGRQAVKNALFWLGDLACVGLWSTELTAAEFTTLSSGVVPSTVRPASLIDYWSLLTQSSTQTGVNGLVLAATDTAQAASHPIVETVADTTAPVMTGSITASSITTTTYSLSWPPATDNVGVTAYEVSIDGGGTWLPVGNQLSASLSGRTPGSTDAVRVRAKDAAGNASTPLATSVTLLSAGDTTPPTLTGAITASNITTSSYNLAWPAATDNVGVTAYEVSLDGGTTWLPVGLLLSCFIGSRTAGATDQVRVRAKDAAGNASTPLSTTVTLLSVGDTTPPTLGGSIAVSGVTPTGYTLSWGAGSDNVGITAYQYSVDGGTTWVTLGNVLTVAVTGRTPGSSDSVRVRARDAAGNTSTPPLATTVNLPSGGPPVLSTPPMKNNTGTLLANLGGIIVNVYDANTGALVLRKTGLSSNAAGVVSFSDAALVSGTSYAYEVVTPANGRRLPVGTAA